MLTVDAVSQSPTGNAYQVASDVTNLLTGRLYTTTWTALISAEKDSVVIWATGLMEQCFEYNGYLKTLTQRLKLPRTGLQDSEGRLLSSDVVPDLILQAHAELCLALSKRDRTAEPDVFGLGMSDIRVGPISIKVDKTMVIGLIPDNVIQMLAPVAEPMLGMPGTGMRQQKLSRT